MYNECETDNRRLEKTVKHFYTHRTTETSIVIIEDFNIYYSDWSIDINTTVIRRTKT